VGLLIWAKRQRLIPGLAKELSLLRQEGGFRLSNTVYEYALQQVGE
jgi:predicted nucleic acid-binding protein